MKLVAKESSRFMRALNAVVRLWCPGFMDYYTTTIGSTIYMPARLIGTPAGDEIVFHEMRHIRNSSGWAALWYYPSYLFPPAVFTFRAVWEFRAYADSLWFEWGAAGHPRDASGRAVVDERVVDGYYVRQFTSSAYLWMFPFRRFMHRQFMKRAATW